MNDIVGPLGDRDIITLYHNHTIHDAMRVRSLNLWTLPHFRQTLADNNILSAPVIMAPSIEEESSDVDQYLGIVDVLQLLKGVLSGTCSCCHF